jgi:hypothetical protein|uniref:RING finger family protein n=1 Tax=Siphoviridae sp. ctMBu2 TaxID=2827853 RepID=A0A8S5T4S1_9CAUD|nr:MAG TPA: RING finger family protein [Siphoviridae sp. ctMBu2]
MKLSFNYTRCPQCNYPLKHYYYECRNCGNQEITNWWKTLAIDAGFLLFIAFVFYKLMGAISLFGQR